MDISGLSQAMSVGYDNSKVTKEEEKKTQGTATSNNVYKEGAAAEYTKSEASTVTQTAKRDTATIEKLKADADRRTAQLRSLVEKMLLKQGQKFTTLSDAMDMIKEGVITVDDETAKEAAAEISDDGYWGVEQTSERLVSFAKALAGNDPEKADVMLEALQKGYDAAAKSWGGELPEICQKTLEVTKQKLNDWKNSSAANSTESSSAAAKTE